MASRVYGQIFKIVPRKYPKSLAINIMHLTFYITGGSSHLTQLKMCYIRIFSLALPLPLPLSLSLSLVYDVAVVV